MAVTVLNTVHAVCTKTQEDQPIQNLALVFLSRNARICDAHPAFFSHSSERKVSRKQKNVNTVKQQRNFTE